MLFGTVAAALVIVGTVLPGQPAVASGAYTSVTSSSFVYTDSRSPETLVENTSGQAPVGSWRDQDGKHHKSRSYFTFDVSRFHGTRILSATGSFAESQVNNCEADRAVEVWLTDPVSGDTSWSNPPAERSKLYAVGPDRFGRCPSPYTEFAVIAALREAVVAGQETLTIELRVPADVEGDVNLGRWVDSQVRVVVEYNTPPRVPRA